MEPSRDTHGRIARIAPEDRFWSKVDKSAGPDGCWLWTGPVKPTGYGYTTDYWKKIYAHRFAYELAKGPIPAGRQVCHTCDVRLCVNPAHLWVGTARDNNQDMVNKGRRGDTRAHNPKRGEEAVHAKLTEDDVRRIRALYEPTRPGFPAGARWHRSHRLTTRDLATLYGVSAVTISNIVRRKTWTHVD